MVLSRGSFVCGDGYLGLAGEPEKEVATCVSTNSNRQAAVNKVKKLVVPMLTPEAAIIWTGLLVIAIMVLAFYLGGADLRAQMRNSFGELSAPIRIAIFGTVSVTLWLVAFTVVSRIVARLHYALDPAYESQRKKKRWVQQLGIGDRLRLTDRDKATYCTISRIDSEQGETFEVTWSDGCKNTLSYFDADLFDEITLGDAGRAARRV